MKRTPAYTSRSRIRVYDHVLIVPLPRVPLPGHFSRVPAVIYRDRRRSRIKKTREISRNYIYTRTHNIRNSGVRSRSSVFIRRNSRRGSSFIIIILASMNSWKPLICISSSPHMRGFGVSSVRLHRPMCFVDHSRSTRDCHVAVTHACRTNPNTGLPPTRNRRKTSHWNPTRLLDASFSCKRIFLSSTLLLLLFSFFLPPLGRFVTLFGVTLTDRDTYLVARVTER